MSKVPTGALQDTVLPFDNKPLQPPGNAFITKPTGKTSFMTTLVAFHQLFVIIILKSNAAGAVYAIVEFVRIPTPSYIDDDASFCCLSITRSGLELIVHVAVQL